MRKPTISPSRITTYLACPVKYRWTYVDPRFRYFLRSKSYYSFGVSLHAALQRFHDSEDVGVQTTDEAVASLEEHWLTGGYSSPDEAAEALAEGRELIARYLESPAVGVADAKVLFVEQQLRKDMGDFDLLGRLDRVDERPDGALEIVENAKKSHEMGITIFDASAGGIGGCPFAPGAPGNVSTEALVNAFETSIDKPKLQFAAEMIRRYL